MLIRNPSLEVAKGMIGSHPEQILMSHAELRKRLPFLKVRRMNVVCHALTI
jgi:hypothetical protein